MHEQYTQEPCWWRFDPTSQVELMWGPHADYEIYDWGQSSVDRIPPPRKTCISLRPYVDMWSGRFYGEWETFQLRAAADGSHGRVSLTEGVSVFSYDPPPLGVWVPAENADAEEAA